MNFHVDHKSSTFFEIVTYFFTVKIAEFGGHYNYGNDEGIKLAYSELSKEIFMTIILKLQHINPKIDSY